MRQRVPGRTPLPAGDSAAAAQSHGSWGRSSLQRSLAGERQPWLVRLTELKLPHRVLAAREAVHLSSGFSAVGGRVGWVLSL